jgi:hypothetical protein
MVALPAAAEVTLQWNTSCVNGSVDAYDYAELSLNLKEESWDSRATLFLVSESQELTLHVLDAYNTSLCENIADLRTSCKMNPNRIEEFTVRIDNTMRSTSSAYKLCAS